MRNWVSMLVLCASGTLGVTFGAWAQATPPSAGDLQRCAAATPQFPQACPCVIATAQTAGITGPTLSRLLSNDVAGIPMDVFQRYGLIYVQCIQQAVTGTVPGMGAQMAPPGQAAPVPVPGGTGVVPPLPGVAAQDIAPIPALPLGTGNPPLGTAQIPPLPLGAGTPPPAGRQVPPLPLGAGAPPPGPGMVPPLPLASAEAGPMDPANPVLRGATFARYPAPSLVMSLSPPRPSGLWGGVIVERGRNGFLLSGVHDGQGRILALQCSGDFTLSPYLVLGGLRLAGDAPSLTLRVLGAGGSVLREERLIGTPVEEQFQMMPLTRRLADALRAGAALEVLAEGGPPIRFGLQGSSAALGRGFCGAERFAEHAYIGGETWIPDGGWRRGVDLSSLLGAEEITSPNSGAVPRLSLTCDRRLRLQSPIFGYGVPFQGEVGIDAYFGQGRLWPVTFAAVPDGAWNELRSPPLPEDLLAAMAGGEVMTVTFNINVEPGEVTTAQYRLRGMSEALAGLVCPAAAGALPPVAAIDLTGRDLAWQPGNFGRSFDVMTPDPSPVPGASSPSFPGAPGLVMQCDGSFWTFGDWPQNGPRFPLRLTVDGDPTTTREVTMEPSRSQHFPAYDAYDLGPRVLAGRTLRVTSLLDPAVDVLYPLDGLVAALRAAGCP